MAAARPVVLGACLRNRMAIARWLADQVRAAQQRPAIAVVAAGERWADESLRSEIVKLTYAVVETTTLRAAALGMVDRDRRAAE